MTTESADLSPHEFYVEHGWYLTPEPIFSAAQIADLRRDEADFFDGSFISPSSPALREYVDNQGRDEALAKTVRDYVALVAPGVLDVVRATVVGGLAGELAGTSAIRLFASGVVSKKPRVDDARSTVGWHTDRAYWRTCSSTKMITAWIPLQDVDAPMGPVTMLDGSHRWPADPEVDAARLAPTFDAEQNIAALDRIARHHGLAVTPVVLEMQAGQVSFHSCLTMHSSGRNVSDRTRTALILHMQDGDNHYQATRRDDSELFRHKNDLMVRQTADGEPDYSDPEICPTLWAAS